MPPKPSCCYSVDIVENEFFASLFRFFTRADTALNLSMTSGEGAWAAKSASKSYMMRLSQALAAEQKDETYHRVLLSLKRVSSKMDIYSVPYQTAQT